MWEHGQVELKNFLLKISKCQRNPHLGYRQKSYYHLFEIHFCPYVPLWTFWPLNILRKQYSSYDPGWVLPCMAAAERMMASSLSLRAVTSSVRSWRSAFRKCPNCLHSSPRSVSCCGSGFVDVWWWGCWGNKRVWEEAKVLGNGWLFM